MYVMGSRWHAYNSFTVLVTIYNIIQSGLGLFLVAIAITCGLTYACTPVCMQYTP